MKSSFCIDLQRFMLIPTKFPLTQEIFVILHRSYYVLINLKSFGMFFVLNYKFCLALMPAYLLYELICLSSRTPLSLMVSLAQIL